jgi:hypothetical protein
MIARASAVLSAFARPPDNVAIGLECPRASRQLWSTRALFTRKCILSPCALPFEDPKDELQRHIQATCWLYNVNSEDIGDRLGVLRFTRVRFPPSVRRHTRGRRLRLAAVRSLAGPAF